MGRTWLRGMAISMKTLDNVRFVPMLAGLFLAGMLVVPAVSIAAQPPVNLGTTKNFAVLAGSTVTNTGPTTIDGNAGGDVGLAPGSEFVSTGVTMSGVQHISDAVAIKAQTDLVAAYDDAAGRTPFTTLDADLTGKTLKSGVYVSTTGELLITGVLTLDAQGDPNAVFIFKSASTLIMMPGSSVRLINGARYCRVFWQVTSSATLDTGSHFVGHLFAMTSISAKTGATIQGQLLARTGAVTLDTNTITNGLCATVSTGTVNGGKLPKTATPWYNLLLAGAVLAMLGAGGLWATTRRIHA